MNKCTIISLRYIGTRHEELKTTAHESVDAWSSSASSHQDRRKAWPERLADRPKGDFFIKKKDQRENTTITSA